MKLSPWLLAPVAAALSSDGFSQDPLFGMVMDAVPGGIVTNLFLQPFYSSSNKIISCLNEPERTPLFVTKNPDLSLWPVWNWGLRTA